MREFEEEAQGLGGARAGQLHHLQRVQDAAEAATQARAVLVAAAAVDKHQQRAEVRRGGKDLVPANKNIRRRQGRGRALTGS